MPEQLKKLDFEQYKLNLLNFGSPMCPCCGADDCERVSPSDADDEGMDTENMSFIVEWRCRNCKKHWGEQFKFVGVVVLDGGDDTEIEDDDEDAGTGNHEEN